MSNSESVVMYAKDFFGEAIDAELYFLKNEEIAYKTDFKNGFVVIAMPDLLEPGVYDVIAKRGEGEYRVNNLMISLSTHYFNHSRLHNDLRLTGGNFKPGEKIERWKFHPSIFENIGYLPENALEIFQDIVKYSGNKDSLRMGGQITLDGGITIDKGLAVVDSNLIEWEKTHLEIPDELGTYLIGISNGNLVISNEIIDYPMATLKNEASDWARLQVDLKYHPVIYQDDIYIFTGIEKSSSDVTMNMSSEEGIFGIVQDGKIFGKARSSISTTQVRLTVSGSGPVLSTDRLYVYSTSDYFLLWENFTLLVALPRWDDSKLFLDWSDGISFVSSGSNGQTKWSSSRPYDKSYITFKSGQEPFTVEEEMNHVIIPNQIIAGNNTTDWDEEVSGTASLTWS